MKAPKGRKFKVVALQFRFPKASAIPQFLWQMVRKVSRHGKPASATGTRVISPTEGTSAIAVLEDLDALKYTMVDAICEERRNEGGADGVHYVIRFVFAAPSSGMKPSLTFVRRQSIIRRELQEIAESALWRVKAFANPFMQGGYVVDGATAANIVFDGRQPFVQGDGQPVTVWQRDATGERIGDAPIPLAPRFHLRAPMGKTIQLQGP